MKKVLLGFVVVAVLVGAMGMTSLVSAKGPATSGQTTGGNGHGRVNGGTGAMINATGEGLEIYHDVILSAYAQALDLSVEELNDLLDSGQTMSQIALDQGLTFDEFTSLMVDARTQALEQAVLDGTLTQAQADWLASRGAGINSGGFGINAGGAGINAGGAGYGMRGGGQGLYLNSDCPYAS